MTVFRSILPAFCLLTHDGGTTAEPVAPLNHAVPPSL